MYSSGCGLRRKGVVVITVHGCTYNTRCCTADTADKSKKECLRVAAKKECKVINGEMRNKHLRKGTKPQKIELPDRMQQRK